MFFLVFVEVGPAVSLIRADGAGEHSLFINSVEVGVRLKQRGTAQHHWLGHPQRVMQDSYQRRTAAQLFAVDLVQCMTLFVCWFMQDTRFARQFVSPLTGKSAAVKTAVQSYQSM